MVRDPWTLAVALFAFGVIGWVVVANVPQRTRFGSRQPEPWFADPDLRLVSERSPYMRTER
jgi:hypothetical protein